MASITVPTSSKLTIGKSSFLAGQKNNALSVPLGHVCKPSSCTVCKRNVLSVKASQQNVEAVEESFSQSIAEAPLASQSVAASSPSPLSGAPAVIGAGLAVAAGLVYVANKLGEKAPAAAPTKAPYSSIPPPQPPVSFTRTVSKAAPAAISAMSQSFPNAVVDSDFVKASAAELFKLGFTKTNCIALVNTCRDEVCRPLATMIDEEFGLSFNLSGLGGLINSGKTGFKAGMSHSPEFPCDVSGKPRERYVFFAFPHVSVGETGEVGSLLRRGRGQPSSACGALIAIKNTASQPVSEDADDAEFVLLKKKVLNSKLCKSAGSGPDLVTVTQAALEVITADLEKIVKQVVDPNTADYAVITGIQIHSGDQIPGQPFKIERTIDYVAPGTMYAVIQGKKYDLQISAPKLPVAA